MSSEKLQYGNIEILCANGVVTFYDLKGLMVTARGLSHLNYTEESVPNRSYRTLSGQSISVPILIGPRNLRLQFDLKHIGTPELVEDLSSLLNILPKFSLLVGPNDVSIPDVSFYDCLMVESHYEEDSLILELKVTGELDMEEDDGL